MSYRSSTRCFAASLSTNNQSRSPQRHSASHVLPTIKRKRTFSEMDSSGYCPRSEGHGEATNSRRRFWTSLDRKSTRLNSSHLGISYAVFCLKKKNKKHRERE